MPFSRESERKDTEITPLIDVVFLLLVFFLLTAGSFRLLESVEKKERYITSKNLPKSAGIPVFSGEPLKNLLIRIEEDSISTRARQLIYFVEPGQEEMIFSTAFQKAKKDSHFFYLFNDTLAMSRSRFVSSFSAKKIQNEILTYREKLRDIPVADRVIDISADRDTPFRIIYYLMEQCSNGDSLTQIKRVNIRTMGRVESEKGTD